MQPDTGGVKPGPVERAYEIMLLRSGGHFEALRDADAWFRDTAQALSDAGLLAPVQEGERLKALADDMYAAAELDERDKSRPITRFDAYRWSGELTHIATASPVLPTGTESAA